MRKITRISACAVALISVLTACISLPQGEPSESQEPGQELPRAGVVIARNSWTDASGAVSVAHVAADVASNASSKESSAGSSTELRAFPAPWSHFFFPGKAATTYRYDYEEGRDAMLALSTASSSLLRRELRLSPAELGLVNFSWKVPDLLTYCGSSAPENDDSPVRIILTFAGDRTKFSAKNAILSELTQLLLGEPLPYATLGYLWSAQLPQESVVMSPRTDRVRSIVVESGRQHLGRWQDYERNIRADYVKAYGEAPGALLRIAVMTDNDNDCSQISAWFGALRFTTTAPP